MPLIQPFDSSADYEEKPVDAGLYDLRITSASVKESKSDKRPGAKFLQFTIAIEGEDAATVFHRLNIPLEDDEPRVQRLMLRDIRRFYKLFGVPEDAPLEEEMVADTFNGLTAKCQLAKVEATDRDGNKTGEWRNELRLPRVA